MVRVVSTTVGDKEAASTKFRLIQYEPYLRSHDIDFHFLPKKQITRGMIRSLGEGDLLINQKCLFNHAISRNLLRRFGRTIFDFDDAIYTRPGKPYSLFVSMRVKSRLALWLRNADLVTTANNYLANYAGQFTDKIQIIPMSLDPERWHPIKRDRLEGNPVRIGWAGSPVNVPYVERLNDVLSRAKKNFNIEIYIYGGKKPVFDFPFTYVPYSEDKEVAFIQHLDIGLLPLIDEEHVRGKSPIKAIQYLSCGIPVVGNAYGATKEILTNDTAMIVESKGEWFEALRALITNRELYMKMSEAALRHFRADFDFEKCAQKWLSIISNPLYSTISRHGESA